MLEGHGRGFLEQQEEAPRGHSHPVSLAAAACCRRLSLASRSRPAAAAARATRSLEETGVRGRCLRVTLPFV
jgi:hypothetical protein